MRTDASRLARVGYLGPAGTFSEQALLASAESHTVEPVALGSIYDTVAALRRGDVSWAVVPIENSLEGSISVTLDLLADASMSDDDASPASSPEGEGEAEAGDLEIVGETLLQVRHALICAQAVPLEEIDTVITHPAVPGQCTRFLHTELAHARVLPASSTAEAVRTVVAEAKPGQAAIGTELAASIYGGTVVRAGIEDRADNETRFVWLGVARSNGAAAPLRREASAAWKTSVVFWGAGADRPGWLVRCLDEFARRDINLTKIESRPRRQRLGNYMFFADLVGRAQDERVAAAIAGVRRMCEQVLVLGSYPALRGASCHLRR